MSQSLAQRLRSAGTAARAAFIRALPPEKAVELAAGRAWWFFRRPEQAEPVGVRRWWLILAGRGWGKTRTGAEWIVEKARAHPGCRCALVAATFTDARDTMVEGEAGILSVLHPQELRGGNVDSAWNRSLGELFLANGSRFKVFSSERPRQLRGPAHHFLWGDEPAYWDDVARGTAKDSTWSNANFGLRARPHPGWLDAETFRTQAVLTTTPRLVPLLKINDNEAASKPHMAGLMQRPTDVTVTRGRTDDNLDNLTAEYRQAVVDPLRGTTLGRQELDAELLEDVEGALWLAGIIAAERVAVSPTLAKVAVALDPSGGEGGGHDEHGIIVAGVAGTRATSEFYVIADYSLNGTPVQAARRCILAYIEHEADVIVVEKNFGDQWLTTVLETTYQQMVSDGEIEPIILAIRTVWAKRSKKLRAEPVAGLYEQRRAHHVGHLPIVEGQMTTWVPGDSDSPDRLDALVYALTWLYGEGPVLADVASAARRERRGRRADMPSSRMPAAYGAGRGRGG